MKATHIAGLAVVACVITMAGCKQLDNHAQPWSQVSMADTRASVHAAMGEPSSINQIELPLIKLEQDAWKSLTGRVYLATFLMDRVVAKNIVE